MGVTEIYESLNMDLHWEVVWCHEIKNILFGYVDQPLQLEMQAISNFSILKLTDTM